MADEVEEWLKDRTRPVVDEELGHSLAHEPVRVPLTVYIGEERHILGEAVVVGNHVKAYILPGVGKDLGDLVQNGLIQNVSVTFNAPPATPVLTETGTIKWVKHY
jgi:hypothetical protein